MTAAPKRGAGDIQTEEGPRRVQPTKALSKSTRDGGLHSVPALRNQPRKALNVRQTRNVFGFGNILLKTTTREDHADLARLKAAGARAGHTLNQLKQLLRYWGLKHPPVELQEMWLRIGVAQYVAIEASRQKWTLTLHGWIRLYMPEISRTWSLKRIDALARKMRREGTCFSPEQKGAMVGVDRETYLALGLSDFWPAGMTPEQRARDQLDHKAAWQRADNLAKGKVKKPHALSLKRTQPWNALGISESTWKRRRRNGELEAGTFE
ncbi:hypothetical protein ABIE45_002652 [Methylobacterium sp. OAE515]|uniref:hypothetical protein n=1 Tax=Methylobacterium sp. OAE515 TaxID=2817895 RepID=UPI00178A5FB0